MLQTPTLLKTDATIKSGDQVVCLSESRLGTLPDTDLAPEDRFKNGQVCLVSGVSDDGKTVWLFDPNDNTGEEHEYRRSQVCRLEQFRSKFPKDISSLFKRNPKRWNQFSPAGAAFNPLPLPNSKGVEDRHQLIHRSLIFVETMFDRGEFLRTLILNPDQWADKESWSKHQILDYDHGRVGWELSDLCCCPQGLAAQMIQSRIIWQLLRRGEKLIVFCRTLSPVAKMIFQMCQRKRVNRIARIIGGLMTEQDFPHLTKAAGQLVGSPIWICDAREQNSFLNILSDAHTGFDFALCDWRLSAGEKSEAYRMTRNSQIRILATGR